MIPRIILPRILKSLKKGRVVSLLGARRTGKTVVMEACRDSLEGEKILLLNGENLDHAEILSSRRTSVLKRYLAGYDLLFIDEAQKIPQIGQNLKLIVDTVPGIAVFVTGSSAFDLRNRIGEPLTGRGKNFYLFPFSQSELYKTPFEAKENLHERLIFGSYPQVVTESNLQEKTEVLESIRNGYLLKDILELDNLKDSLFILNLLRLLAFQIGNDVSLSELAGRLQVSRKTVIRYLDLLEKCYIIFPLYGFSRNLRQEFSKSPRFFFWDNGIRNTVISNFNRLELRDDTGRLWENFCISERLKLNHYKGLQASYYFWRTYEQKEIDLVEESGGSLHGFEFKWKSGKIKPPSGFMKTYKNSGFTQVDSENYFDFLF